ncbi:MarR family winged helix-turn-helix transcriptional regulator [Paeniglutamicibacter kerguelensis]|uniref:DNA-binding MarR family transcriptional regulator n=1 Tax=Paeniglutamicibacter kerguelensis TaxID=254788 RepID=A0ABS4X8E2_9MICC|nr:MarR family transcriptional regulator [Paeniglutamicibacter kerguelensis]MBP2384734.1 DNA-binding MarR family transcriptional regulator [Paeniglutamicibacter kerguelensis]
MTTDLGTTLTRLLAATHRLSRSATIRLEHGYSASYYRTLGILADGTPLRIGQLAEYNKISQPGMTKMLASLESRDLVQRIQDPTDSRAWLIDITATGREALVQRRLELAMVLEQDFVSLSAREIAVLAEAAEILESRSTPAPGGNP